MSSAESPQAGWGWSSCPGSWAGEEVDLGGPGSTPCMYGQVTGGTEPWPSQGPGPGACDTCHKLKRGRF